MFSQQLAPIFHQAADIIHEEYSVSLNVTSRKHPWKN